jgi:hypothetical protein
MTMSSVCITKGLSSEFTPLRRVGRSPRDKWDVIDLIVAGRTLDATNLLREAANGGRKVMLHG